MKIITTIILLLFAASPSLAFDLPEGYRYPAKSDMVGDWEFFEKEIPEPYHTKADFDGNGVVDHAWILLRTKDQGWGLFVGLNDKMLVSLDVSEESYPQRMGISTIEPGEHKTACGKGYWACEPDEPEVLKLESPGLFYFLFESAASVYYWNEKVGKFNRVWLSD